MTVPSGNPSRRLRMSGWRRNLAIAIAAVAGLFLAAALTTAASTLSGQSIGLSSEPLTRRPRARAGRDRGAGADADGDAAAEADAAPAATRRRSRPDRGADLGPHRRR